MSLVGGLLSAGFSACLVLALALLVGRLLARREETVERARRESQAARTTGSHVRRASIPWRVRCQGGIEHVICQTCYLELAAGSYQIATALRDPRTALAGERCAGCSRPFSPEGSR